jgi:hypothetical protein
MFQIYRGLWLLREERPLLFCTFLSTFFLSLAALGKVLDKYRTVPLLWIRVILVPVRVPLTYGSASESCFFRQWLTRCQQKISFVFQVFLLVFF